MFNWQYLFIAHYQLVLQSFTTKNVIFARTHCVILGFFFFLGVISFVSSDKRGILDLVVHDVIILLGYLVIIVLCSSTVIQFWFIFVPMCSDKNVSIYQEFFMYCGNVNRVLR